MNGSNNRCNERMMEGMADWEWWRSGRVLEEM